MSLRAAERDASPLSPALLVLAAALALAHLALPLGSLLRLAPLNYNEGWNAYHAEAVLDERPLYPPPGALFPNNYPPLSFVLVAPLAQLTGHGVLVGRLLSLLALLAIAAEIAVLAARAGASRRSALFAALLFVALLTTLAPDYVGVSDPQLLGHALVLGGAVVLSGGRSRARLAGAAVLMALGGLVKHNLVALPLAVTAWLWLQDRRAFREWLALAAAVLGAALLALALAFGGDFFAAIVGPRTTSLALAAHKTADWLPALAAPLAVGVLACAAAWRDAEARLFALYAGFGLAAGVASSAGAGVSYNAYFDLAIALCLLGGWALARAPAHATALVLALLLGPLLRAPHALLGLREGLAEIGRIEDATRRDVDYLAARGEPVLCETLALCFWAGKAPVLDFFNSRQAFAAGRADEDALIARIAKREFAIVQLTSFFDGRNDERISLAVMRELRLRYVPHRVSANGVFLRPRR